MQIEPERSRSACGSVEERRRFRRKQRAWASREPRPGRRRWHKVREVETVEQGPANIGNSVPRHRAQKGFQRIDRLDTACEAEAPKLPADDASLVLDLLPAFAHQDENGCVITEHDKVRARIGDGVLGLLRHQHGILVDHAALRFEHLAEKALVRCFHFRWLARKVPMAS